MGRLDDLKPALTMVFLQVLYAGNALLSKLALSEGLNVRIYIVYRQATATLIPTLAAYAFKRRIGSSMCCGLTWKSFWWIFTASFVGVTLNLNAYAEGLYLSSASAASAIVSLVPAFTFVFATFLRLEKVKFNMRSIGKVTGNLICISGTVAVAFLRGSKLINTITGTFQDQEWVAGCLCLFASVCFWSIWFILQVPITKCHPDHVSAAAWICLFSFLQSVVVALVAERGLIVWIVKPMQLAACVYAGLFATGLAFFLQAWCVSIKGPVFTSMLHPLCTVIVTVIACAFLHEALYVGSLIGSILVIIELYIVLWGKAVDSDLSKSPTVDFAGRVRSSSDLEDPLISTE